MTYQEAEYLVCKYLTDVERELLYYYTNYLYVTSNRNLFPKNETIEDLLKKANTFGRHLNFYNPQEENIKEWVQTFEDMLELIANVAPLISVLI